MDVSIVINNYNYDEYIGDAIESALKQKYERTEVIVVDDGSEDRSRDIIRSYKPHIRMVFKPNGGQASALNEGFKASRGDVIFFLDADDILYPNATERVVEEWASRTAQVHFRLQCIDSDGNSLDRRIPRREKDLPEGDLVDHISAWGGYRSVPTTGNAFHASVLKKILPIPEEEYRICADIYIALMSPLHGPILSIDEILGGYRDHDTNRWSNKTGLLSKNMLEEKVNFRLKKKNLVRENYPTPKIRHHSFSVVNIERVKISGIKTKKDIHKLFGSVVKGCKRIRAFYRDSWKMRFFWVTWLVVAAFAPRYVSIRLIVFHLMPPNQHPKWLRSIRKFLKK